MDVKQYLLSIEDIQYIIEQARIKGNEFTFKEFDNLLEIEDSKFISSYNLGQIITID